MTDFKFQLKQITNNTIQETPIMMQAKIVSCNNGSANVQILYGLSGVTSHYNPGEILKDVPLNTGQGMINIDAKVGDSVLLGFLGTKQSSPYIIKHNNEFQATTSETTLYEKKSEISIASSSQNQIYYTETKDIKVTATNKNSNYNGNFTTDMVKNQSDINASILNKYKDNLTWPAPGHNNITSLYGIRSSGVHHGIDIACQEGSNIVSAADGIIYKVVNINAGTYGKYILIKHDYNFYTRYAHLNDVLVKVGEQVKASQLIGKSGNTGRSTGGHLHFETMQEAGTKYFDPVIFLKEL